MSEGGVVNRLSSMGGAAISLCKEKGGEKGVLTATQMEVSRMTGPSGPTAKDDRGSVGEVVQLVKYCAC